MSTTLCRLGHIATTRELNAHGITAWQLHRGVRQGLVARPRRGLYACLHIDADLRRAAELGGALTCVTVLRRAGVWAGDDHRTHVLVSPGAAAEPSGDVRLHWEGRPPPALHGEVDGAEAVRQALRCLDTENAVATLESAGHEGFLEHGEVTRLLRQAPRRVSRAVDELEFRSGSGNETITRLRLIREGYRVEAQGYVPGLGHQDLVVEDCVGIEVDGRRWHGEDRFAQDGDRDIQSEALGRRVLRLRAAHIFETWPQTLAAIHRAVADAKVEQSSRRPR